MFYVYTLRCSDQSLYLGHTRNIKRRLETHNAGLGAAFTSKRRPVTVVYTEPHDTRTAAIRRERQLDRWRSAASTRQLLMPQLIVPVSPSARKSYTDSGGVLAG